MSVMWKELVHQLVSKFRGLIVVAVLLLGSRSICNVRGQASSGFVAEIVWTEETLRFMVYALEKMVGTKCLTFASDEHLGYMTGSLSACKFHLKFCSVYNYEIRYDGGNLTTTIEDTLKAGYDRRCAGYVILFRDTSRVIEFLEAGHLQRIVNTRARFLIWYDGNDKTFEANYLWEKIPDVIFFHSKPKKRQQGLLFTVRQLKWPVASNSTESRLRVLEFWADKSLQNGNGQIWFYDKTLDLKNVTLRIVVVEHPPGVIKYIDSSGAVKYAGTEIQIMRSLSKTMKFSYEFHDADPETKWGGQVAGNKSCPGERRFQGAVARLIYGEADIGIGSFFLLKHYLDYVDMSIPLEVACTSLMTPNPLQRPRYLALILPFRTDLWLLLIATSLVIGPGLMTIFFAAHRIPGSQEYSVFRPKQACLTSFRIMTQVAIHLWPKLWPMRLFIGWYWVFWFCVTSGYRGAMVSFLTIPLYEKSIDNLHDLEASELQLGGWGTELQRIFLQHLQVNSNVKMGKSLTNRYEVINNLDEGISRVAGGKFALYENVRFLKFIRMTRNISAAGSPTMRVMRQCVVPVHIGFLYQKNSALTQTINRYIRSFQESGLTKRWAQRLVALTREHQRNKPEASGVDRSGGSVEGGDSSESDSSRNSRSQRVLRIQDLQGAVYVLFLGLGVSGLSFSAELLYRRRSRSRKLEANKVVNKSRMITRAWELKSKVVDVRVRPKPKSKQLRKRPPFPYLD